MRKVKEFFDFIFERDVRYVIKFNILFTHFVLLKRCILSESWNELE